MDEEIKKAFCKQVSEEAYLMFKGVRHCALMDCWRVDDELREVLKEEVDSWAEWDPKLKYHIQSKSGWVYLIHYDWQRVAIELDALLADENFNIHSIPNLDRWLCEFLKGKLLGYSDESMEEYLQKWCLSWQEFEKYFTSSNSSEQFNSSSKYHENKHGGIIHGKKETITRSGHE